MGFNSNIQHQAATTYYTRVFQNPLPPILTACGRSFFKREKFAIICKLTATTHSEGAEVIGKSRFKKPELLLSVQEKAKNDTKDQAINTSLFQVILTTSKEYGSGISDLNAGIQLAFIGEDGRCFMHTLSNLVSPNMFETSAQPQETHSPYRFQRGAQDVVTFSGPDLGKLEAVWVAPEKGTWRLQDMIVRVSSSRLVNRAVTEDAEGKILQYMFACEESLIGEDETSSAAELQVSSITEISNEDFLDVSSLKNGSGLQTNLDQLRDEGLKEYETLKLSLLSYDALLVIAGSAIAAVAGHGDISEGYLIGGILGFLYLFVLERAVDQLPALSSSPFSLSNTENRSITSKSKDATGKDLDDLNMTESTLEPVGSFNGFRAPLTRLAGVLALCVLLAKVTDTADNQALSKEMLFAGAAGFLMTKIATILASNMPLSLNQGHSSGGEA